ncbi:hypothetical protein LDL34_10445 [Lactobacillus delbrueckii subsp. lactis]|nr:hypothetical protein LL717_10220 [Lactobacillus delbrueckii subsp. lactis]ASW64672.1 hypothetical protein LDL34_10445 [Lactobacillus delbrueckii subsp. lactis]OOV03578.1 hypothetical protein LL034_01465 [Lactobacillus delbrueckii subsp. lactis]
MTIDQGLIDTALLGAYFKYCKTKGYFCKISKKVSLSDMTPEIRTLISGVIFMTKYTKEIKLAIYHEWVDDHRRTLSILLCK